MYGIYGDIVQAAQSALADFDETKELLEYPEVQADKAYYLSVLNKYNTLNNLKEKLSALLDALKEESELSALLSETENAEEREAIFTELSAIKRTQSSISAALSSLLGCKHIREKAYCRFKFTAVSAKFGVPLYELLIEYLLANGAQISDEKKAYAKEGYLQTVAFIVEGEDIIAKLSPLTGAHRVNILGAKSDELCFAVTTVGDIQKISESDLKIDVFHSSGAGGQNINKVETAVRVTHIPTGTVVVCQDERSQLKNKKRALETIEKRLFESQQAIEKKRIEADISAQYRKKNTPISFDLASETMTDTRLKGYNKVPFPLTDFSSYINGLIAL